MKKSYDGFSVGRYDGIFNGRRILEGRTKSKRAEIAFSHEGTTLKLWKSNRLNDWIASKVEPWIDYRRTLDFGALFIASGFFAIVISLFSFLLMTWEPLLAISIIPLAFGLDWWMVHQSNESKEARRQAESLAFPFRNFPSDSESDSDSHVFSLGVEDFPIEHAEELYTALLSVKRAETILAEMEKAKEEWKHDDSFLPLLDNGIQDKEENLSVAEDDLKEVIQKVNLWYQERKQEELMDLLNKR